MKDTLATGKDSYGPFPNNVCVFNVFRNLADSVTGVCPPIYGSYSEGPGGDHPSNAAVAVIDPAFVKETFDAVLAYEKIAGVSAAKWERSWMRTGNRETTPYDMMRDDSPAASLCTGSAPDRMWTRRGCLS